MPGSLYLVRLGYQQKSAGFQSSQILIGQWCAGWHPENLLHMCQFQGQQMRSVPTSSGYAIFLTCAGTNRSRNRSMVAMRTTMHDTVWRWQCRWWSPREMAMKLQPDKVTQVIHRWGAGIMVWGLVICTCLGLRVPRVFFQQGLYEHIPHQNKNAKLAVSSDSRELNLSKSQDNPVQQHDDIDKARMGSLCNDKQCMDLWHPYMSSAKALKNQTPLQ